MEYRALDHTDFFKIVVVDGETGRGVPLVELKTTNGVKYYTDSNGIIAFFESALMDQDVLFHIKSHGYEFTQTVLGEPGKVVKIIKGKNVRLKIKRINIAERLYRITGEGIYRDSIMAGRRIPVRHPLINALVMGQDTVLATPYRGKLYWFWGDTFGPSGLNTVVSGATSLLPGKGGLDPDTGVDFDYFTDKSGFCKKICPFPGPGRVWLDWIVTLKDKKGVKRLFARYSRIKNLEKVYERGFAVFNDKTKNFERLMRFDEENNLPHLSTHPFRASVEGKDYFYFTSKYAFSRVRADFEHMLEPKKYESFTCLAAGSRYGKHPFCLDRRSDESLRYAWKEDTDFVDYDRQQELIAKKKIKRQEGLLHLQDIDTTMPIAAYPGSVFWNEFRRRWIMIAQKEIGEVWYAEADTPVGPWVYCKKIASHDRYTFYNLTQHPFFDKNGGRHIYFEGTFTNWFSGNRDNVPRYDYNQIMYKLRLDDQRLFLPSPVYRVTDARGKPCFMLRESIESKNYWERIEEIAFFAIPPDRKKEGLIPVFAFMEKDGAVLYSEPADKNEKSVQPLFYALPASFSTSKLKLSGVWQCNAKFSDGSKKPFRFKIEAAGKKIKAVSMQDNILISNTRFKGDNLKFELKYDNIIFAVVAALKQGELTGKWERTDTGAIGRWDGKRIDFAWQQAASQAVVPLFEYRRDNPYARYYSTKPDLKDKTIKRAVDPVCRIWQNPMSMLIFDYKAKPVLNKNNNKHEIHLRHSTPD